MCVCLNIMSFGKLPKKYIYTAFVLDYPGNTHQEYFNHICGSLLYFKKSYSSPLNILRSIVPQMFITISIKKFKPKFNQLSVNLLKCPDHVQMGAAW